MEILPEKSETVTFLGRLGEMQQHNCG